MTWNTITNGTLTDATKVMENLYELRASYILSAQNLIRVLIDRTAVYSAGQIDWWGDAYIDNTGRMDTVFTDRTLTTARFDTNKFSPGITNVSGSGTLNDPDSFTNPSNAFDNNNSTSAVKSGLTGAQTLELGKTFSSTRIDQAYLIIAGSANGGGSNITTSLYLETYNGSVWTQTGGVLASNFGSVTMPVSFTGWVTINQANCQGVRAVFNTTNGSAGSVSATFTTINFGVMAASQIYTSIPLDTFVTGISSAIGVPLLDSWETGADVRYKLLNSDIGTGFIIIEATSVASRTNWQINDCDIMQLSSTKWALFGKSGTSAVRFAKCAKTLFYGTDGSNPRATSTYITGITALKSPYSNDVGKRVVYAQMVSTASSSLRTYTGTFANTTTNTNCRSWSYIDAPFGTGPTWQMPSGTTLNSASGSISDETATDTTADDKNNPATCVHSAADQGTVRTIIFVNSTISWVLNNATNCTAANTDFTVTHSMPTFTLATETFTDDTGWLNCGVTPVLSSFTTFVAQATSMIIELTPKSSSPTVGTPALRGFVIRAS